MSVSVTYTFTNGTDADAAEVNQNFNDLVTFINNSVVLADGTVAFTGVPSGPSADPTSANQFTRKSYVDGLVSPLAATTYVDAADALKADVTYVDAQIATRQVAGSYAASSHTHTSGEVSGDFNADRINAGDFETGRYRFPTRLAIGGGTDDTRVLYVESGDATELYRETSTGGDGVLVLSSNIGGTGTSKHIFYADGDYIADGSIQCTALTETSDERVKANVRPIGLDEALTRLESWNLVAFDRLQDGSAGRGVVAQSLQGGPSEDLVKVGLDKDETLSVHYVGMVPDIARVVQELAEKAGL